jgi:hypothetical protein
MANFPDPLSRRSRVVETNCRFGEKINLDDFRVRTIAANPGTNFDEARKD